MKPPCVDTLFTRMVTPNPGSGTLAQPKWPIDGLGATQ